MMREEYDVLVAGAGASGLCAAAAAAREGAEVLLIEQSGIPGGTNTQSLVGPLMGFHAGNCQVIGGLAQEIVDRLAARGGTRGHIPDPLGVASSITPVEPEILKQVEFDLLREEKRITTLFHTALAGVQAEDGMIRTIRTLGKEGERSFSAKVFIDATGDGDLASGAGAPFLQGREEDGLSQPMTMIFKIGGVDFERIREAMRRRPGQFVLCEEWEKIPFTAVSGYFEEVRKARDEGLLTFPRDRVLLFEGVRPGEATVNMGRIVGRNPLNAEEKSRAEMEGHAQADEILRFLRERIDGFRDAVRALGIPQERCEVILQDDLDSGKMQKAFDYFRRWLAGAPARGDGRVIMTSNDMIAQGVISASLRSGLRVPGDVAVFGFDNISIAACATPSISTVVQDPYLLGEKCFELLMRRMSSPRERVDNLMLEQRVALRESARLDAANAVAEGLAVEPME